MRQRTRSILKCGTCAASLYWLYSETSIGRMSRSTQVVATGRRPRQNSFRARRTSCKDVAGGALCMICQLRLRPEHSLRTQSLVLGTGLFCTCASTHGSMPKAMAAFACSSAPSKDAAKHQQVGLHRSRSLRLGCRKWRLPTCWPQPQQRRSIPQQLLTSRSVAPAVSGPPSCSLHQDRLAACAS